MASRLEQDLSCPICCELFRDPVLLSCSHSFCKVCLENWWEDKPLKTCPVCQSKISMDPPLNLTLKNLVETFTEERRQTSPAQLSDVSLQVLAYITAQARRAQTQIRAQFEKLHQFLREEEESRMKALKEEEEQKIQNMKDKMAAVSRDMEAVPQGVSETEEQVRAADASPAVEEIEPGALIDEAKHLGNLGFNIWRNMKSLVKFFPVILDPNTAGPHMILSEDLSSVRQGEAQEVPQNPERRFFEVLGSEKFASGTHSWDVEVGESDHWGVGVIEFVQRGDVTEARKWHMYCCYGSYSAHSPTDRERLSVENLQRVRVKLDFGTKTLTFTDPDTNTDLHTVTEFIAEGLTPFLLTSQGVPLKILPRNITVTE